MSDERSGRGISGTVLDQAVAAVPGIASLVITFRLPDDLRPLAETSLVVVIIGTLSWLFVQRNAIRKRRSRAIQRTLIRATILAVVCYLGFGLAYGANISSYSFGDGTGRIFAPSTLRSGSWEHPFVDCSLTIDRLCDKDKGTLRYVPTADAVASFITVNGPGSLVIPRTTSWYAWLITLVLLDSLAASSLVALFGIVRIRGLRPLDLLREDSATDQSTKSGLA